MKQIFISFGIILLVSSLTATNIRKDVPPRSVLIDHSSDPTLHHVIRRTPTINTETRVAPMLKIEQQSDYMTFGNNNDNNGASLPPVNYGKAPEIVGPQIIVHSRGTIPVITEQPAWVGDRSEEKVITSLNKQTGIMIN